MGTPQTYLSSTLFFLIIFIIIINIIPLFPLFHLGFFSKFYVAWGRRGQHHRWQHWARWTGTRRHRRDDLRCNGCQWWSRRLGWRDYRLAVPGHDFVVTWKKPLLDWKMLGFGRLCCEWLRWVGQGASGRGVRRKAEG